MVSFPGIGDESEVANPAVGRGAGSGRIVAFRKCDDGAARRRRFQPPAIVEQPPRQSRSPKSDGDDFRHEPTMPGRLAVRLSGLFRICGFLCRFRAGGEPPDRGRAAPVRAVSIGGVESPGRNQRPSRRLVRDNRLVGGVMDNDKSIFEKITDTVKDIANIAADAASQALKAEEPALKAGQTAVAYMPLAGDGLVSDPMMVAPISTAPRRKRKLAATKRRARPAKKARAKKAVKKSAKRTVKKTARKTSKKTSKKASKRTSRKTQRNLQRERPRRRRQSVRGKQNSHGAEGSRKWNAWPFPDRRARLPPKLSPATIAIHEIMITDEY